MNLLGALLTLLSVFVLWQVWQAQRLVRAHSQVVEAWERTNDLLRQRRDFVHQVVLYSESMGWWENEAMERLMRASQAVRKAATREERFEAERALGSALRHTMGTLDRIAPRDGTEDLALMAHFWSSTERKIDFARRYYNSAADSLNRRLDTRLAKAMIRFKAVRKHEPFAPEDARGNHPV